MTVETPPEGFTPISSSNPFGTAVGPVYELQNDEGWVRGVVIEDRHANRGGVAHGGMLMSFADIVSARAAMEVTNERFVTLRLAADFVAPAPIGLWLEGRAKVTKQKGSTLFIACRLEAAGKLILRASAVFKTI